MTMSNAKIAQACNHLGLGLFGLGMNQEAALAFRQAIAVDAAFAEAHHNLANVLCADGKITAALRYYNEAIRRKPGLSGAHLDLGRALASLAQFDNAIAAFRQTLAIEPQCVEAAVALSTACRLKGDLDQAIAAAEAAIALPDRTGACYFALGLAQQARGRLDQAIGAYQHAVTIRPDFDVAHKHLHNLVVNVQARRNAIAESAATPAWPQGFASSFDPDRKPEFAIVCFHNIGDILLCTPIARQLKHDHPDGRVVWYTSESYAFALKDNPYIDEVVALGGGSPQAMYDMYEDKLRNERPWTRFISPAPYRNYDKVPFGNLLDLVRAGADMEITVPMAPVVRLTKLEEAAAKRYWDRLPAGPKILVECEFKSGQSLWDHSDTLAMIEALEEFEPVFVFTSKNKPAFLIDLAKRYPKIVWCGEAYRRNAYFFNHAAALIGVSSGISALVRSDYCRRDVPVIEFSKGEHWSSAIHEDSDNLQVAFSRPRFRDALARLAAHFRGQALEPDFSPRFPPSSRPDALIEHFPCPNCGSVRATPVRAGIVVRCDDCQLVHLRERPKGSPVATGHPGLRLPSPEEIRAPARLPPSAEAVDTVEEFLALQRREEFTRIEAAYGRPVAGRSFVGIGCGWGATMLYARQRRMTPIGFYASRRERDFAVNRLGLDVRDVGFMDADLPPGSVDIVAIDGALAEAAHPFEFMQKVGHVLAPGGVCHLTAFNFNSIFSWVLQELWWGFDPSRQSVFFTPGTLRDLVSQAGFHIRSCHTSSQGPRLDQAIATMRRWWPEKTVEDCLKVLAQFDRDGYGDNIQLIGVKRAAPHVRLKGALPAVGADQPATHLTAPVRRFLNGGRGIGQIDLVGMLEAMDWQGVRQVNLLDGGIFGRLLTMGWHEPANGELWAAERNASIGLKITNAGSAAKDLMVTLTAKAPPAEPAAKEAEPAPKEAEPLTVDVLVNGTAVTRSQLPGDSWTTLRVMVPERLIGGQGELVVELVGSALAAAPEAGGQRKRGVGLKAATIDTLSATLMTPPLAEEEVDLVHPDVFGRIWVEGFHSLEKWGSSWAVWARTEKARVAFPIETGGGADLLFEARICIQPGLLEPMRIGLAVNGRNLVEWVAKEAGRLMAISAVIPAAVIRGEPLLSLEFSSSLVVSPAALGASTDTRRLGVGFLRMTVTERKGEVGPGAVENRVMA